jgi:hypothetical protein
VQIVDADSSATRYDAVLAASSAAGNRCRLLFNNPLVPERVAAVRVEELIGRSKRTSEASEPTRATSALTRYGAQAGARVAEQRARERVGGSGGAKPPRLDWCAQHDSNVRPPGS